MGRCAESDFGSKICDDERAGGIESVPGERRGVCRHQGLADTAVAPPFARPHEQAAVLRLQLEDLAELDVQASGNELGGGIEQVGPRHSSQGLLAEVRHRLLLTRRRAQLLLGTARFLDAQPAEPLRSHPSSVPWKGIES